MTTITGLSKSVPRRSGLRKLANRGFSLAELLIATAIAAMILTVAASTVVTLAKGSRSLMNYTEMNTQSRHALDNLGLYLRSASDVHTATSTRLVIDRIDHAGNTEKIAYDYDPDARTLTMTRGGLARIILTDVDSLSFNYFTLRQAPTLNPLEVKHVQLEAELTRDVLSLTNHNYIISARFMLRNRRVSN